MLQQHTAHQRAKGRPAGTDRRPDAKGNITLARIGKQGADPRQRRRDDHRRTNGERCPRHDQPPRRRRKCRRQRRQAKQATADHQQALKTNPVAQRAHR
ncbi:hypothetical protein D3C75_994270 [compost metagenome]